MRPRNSEVVFIVDEDAGTNVRDGIVLANGKAVMLYDHVPKGTADVDWLPQAHLWGNAIITRDLNMRKIPFERDALRRCGCHVFIIRCRGATFETLKNLATKHYEKMANMVVAYEPPFIAHVRADTVEVIGKPTRRSAIKRLR